MKTEPPQPPASLPVTESQWRPASQAPKDGTRILTLDEDADISVGWWEAESGADATQVHRNRVHAWLINNNKVWHELHEYEALMAEYGPQVPMPELGYWTSETAHYYGRQDEIVLTHWMPLPELPK